MTLHVHLCVSEWECEWLSMCECRVGLCESYGGSIVVLRVPMRYNRKMSLHFKRFRFAKRLGIPCLGLSKISCLKCILKAHLDFPYKT